MEKHMLAYIALFAVAAFTSVHGAKDMKMLEVFCADKLGQSINDVNQCSSKPSGYTTGIFDDAVLAYLCCLGVFGDVTYDYTKYTSADLIRHFAETTTETQVLDIANFILMCRNGMPLTKADYLNWQNKGRTILSCRAP